MITREQMLVAVYGGGDNAVAAVTEYLNQRDEMVDRITEVFAAIRWIPVTERLPAEYETVLVSTNGGVSAGEMRFTDIFTDGEDEMPDLWWMVFKDKRDAFPGHWAGFVAFHDVTHWMPLPSPPETNK